MTQINMRLRQNRTHNGIFRDVSQVYGKGWYNVWKDKWGETHADQARTEIEAIIAMYDPNAAPPSPPPPTPPPTSPPAPPNCPDACTGNGCTSSVPLAVYNSDRALCTEACVDDGYCCTNNKGGCQRLTCTMGCPLLPIVRRQNFCASMVQACVCCCCYCW